MYAAETNGDHQKASVEEGISEEVAQKVSKILGLNAAKIDFKNVFKKKSSKKNRQV